MMLNRQSQSDHRQRGAALLIAIFALLLISVVAIALIVASGTDSALARNYRGSSSAYYAALAGLEEGRGRLLWRNPAFINKTVANFVPPTGAVLDAHQVLYIINPVGGASIVPTDPSNPYADTEYASEFDWGLAGATVQPFVNSVSPTPGVPNPPYAWVRITPVTEHSMGDVDVDGLNANDHLTPLFYNGSGLNRTNSGSQALEVTTLAVMPNGTRKMLQYVTVPLTFSLSFPSALTLLGSSGNNVQFTGPGTPSFYISGTDSVPVGACSPSSPPVFAIGYGNGSDASGIHASPPDKYSGAGGSSTVPSVGAVTLPASMQSVNGLNGLVQGIASSADAAFSPISPATAIYGSQLPSGMSASNPMTVVVNGDLDLTDWHGVGYGLLLVTGTLTYDPDATWNGIVLVIGKGNLVSIKGGVHQINGALFIAKTVDNSGNPLSSFGPASFSQTGVDPSGYGVYFSSCNISAAQQPTSYKVLSFREIPLAD